MRALVLLALVSCADDGGIRWTLPPDMTAEERADFDASCDAWNAIAVRQQSVDIIGDGHVVMTDHMGAFRDPNGDGINDVRGEMGGHWMHLRPGMSRTEFRIVVRHEQGHALGLRHVQAGVMSETEAGGEFSEEDLAECRRVNACR